MTWRPPRGVLGGLVAAAKDASAERRRRSVQPVEAEPREGDSGRFVSALTARRGGFPLICEVKRASPSGGVLRAEASAPSTARTYVSAGARCVSVLTEESRFGGSLADLAEVRRAVDVPLLRKDFIVDPWMVSEAAAAGADAVLLIVAAVEPSLLLELASAADAHGLDVLLELIYERDLEALGLRQWPLVGVNARDLETLEMDSGRFARLARHAAAPGRLLVAESGIREPADIVHFRSAGAGAALVGESLMRSADPAATVRSLVEAR